MTRTIMLRLAMLATAVLLVVALQKLQARTPSTVRTRTTTSDARDASPRVVQRDAAVASTRPLRASAIGELPAGMVPVSRVDPPLRDPSLRLPPPPVAPPNPAEHRPMAIAWPDPR